MPNTASFLAIIATIATQKIMINLSQCHHGKVDMGHYETSSQLLDLGVISGYDLTLEATLAKLYWLLGQNNHNHDSNTIASQMQKCYRGEIMLNN